MHYKFNKILYSDLTKINGAKTKSCLPSRLSQTKTFLGDLIYIQSFNHYCMYENYENLVFLENRHFIKANGVKTNSCLSCCP